MQGLDRGRRSLGNQLEDRLVLQGTRAAIASIPVVGPLLEPFAPVVAPVVEGVIDAAGSLLSSVFTTSFDYEKSYQGTSFENAADRGGGARDLAILREL